MPGHDDGPSVTSAAGAGGGLGIRVYRAARDGDEARALALLRDYLDHGGDKGEIFAFDPYGASAFDLWAGTGCEGLVGLLEPVPWTVFTALAWRRQELAARLATADVLATEQGVGNPLHWALNRACLDFARWASSRLDVPATEGRVGYVRAATFGRHETAIRFAAGECGADIDYGEQTALHHEVKHGWPKLVPLLLELGADPNRTDGDGNTALHLAAKRGTSGKLVRMLLEAGADPRVRNAAGEIPRDLARRAKRPHAARALDAM